MVVLTELLLRYDRRSPELAEALAPGRPLHALIELVASDSAAVDLQIRADPQSKRAHATLYVGLTRAIHVERHPSKGWRLDLQQGKSFNLPPLDRDPWLTWRSLSEVEADWPAVMDRVRQTIRACPPAKRDTEGRLQAALAKPNHDFQLIDREALPFSKGAAALLRQLRAPIEDAARDLGNLHRWAQQEKKWGMELDALAIDADGSILVIETKDGSDTAGFGWTPAQVAFYLRVFESWAAQDPNHAKEVLDGMAEQRERIGLGRRRTVGRNLSFIPVVAIGTPVKNPDAANDRMRIVHDALNAHGVPLGRLQVWRVHPDGALQRRRLGDL